MNNKRNAFKRILFIIGALGPCLLLLWAARFSQAAPKNIFTVNSTNNADDGTCDAVHCSLREAIQAANAGGGADTIVFSLAPESTLAGSQLPVITDTLTIDGSTALSLTISGSNRRIFEIGDGTAVTITTLTITKGWASHGGGLLNGSSTLTISNTTFIRNFFSDEVCGCWNGGGAIYNEGGTVNVYNSAFRLNGDIYGVFQGMGGAIYNTGNGTVNISGSTFITNQVAFWGAVIANDGGTVNISGSEFIGNQAFQDSEYDPAPGGGAIYTWGTMNISNSTFSSNHSFGLQSGFAGAIRNDGQLNLSNSTLSGNSSSGSDSFGGGIYNDGQLNISNSTLSGNSSSGPDSFGGGIYNDGQLNISNSTLSGNSSLGSDSFGGGIYNDGQLNISNSTFSNNSAYNYSGGGEGGGIFNDSSGTLNFSNTLIANSGGGDCVTYGPIGVNLNNLIEDGSCLPAFSGDPLLGPLQDNGGPTWTQALLSISLAVDNADSFICAVSPVNNLDQRGVMRPLDGDGDGVARCDIGAYEYDGPPPVRFYLPLVFQN